MPIEALREAGIDVEEHQKEDHDCWNYFCYYSSLMEFINAGNELELNGDESCMYKCFKERSKRFFPIGSSVYLQRKREREEPKRERAEMEEGKMEKEKAEESGVEGEEVRKRRREIELHRGISSSLESATEYPAITGASETGRMWGHVVQLSEDIVDLTVTGRKDVEEIMKETKESEKEWKVISKEVEEWRKDRVKKSGKEKNEEEREMYSSPPSSYSFHLLPNYPPPPFPLPPSPKLLLLFPLLPLSLIQSIPLAPSPGTSFTSS
jgi:hypothetical protein